MPTDILNPVTLELLLSLGLGVGLAAACGFRVFVPFLVMSIAAQSGHLDLAPAWDWIGSWPALAILAVATILEITAYYIPWLDNLLDTIATPAAVVAGIVASAAVISGMSPLLTWTLAAIAGGGVAGIVQASTVLVRGMSTTTTLGGGNAVVASGEIAGAVGMALLAIILPGLALIAVLLGLFWIARRLRRPRVPVR